MRSANWRARAWRHGALVGVLGLMLTGFVLLARAADHRDGPIFKDTKNNGRADLNDIYLFQSPANPANTVLIMDVSPAPGVETPPTFDETVTFDFNIDNTGDAVQDITFRMTFGAPDANGVQNVTLRALPASRFPPTGILAQGKTGQNIAVRGGGMFRAAIQDDPFFFDATGFNNFIANGTAPFPRPKPANPANPQPGDAQNFFGPNVNTLSIILEIPSSKITSPGNNIIGAWIATSRNGVQLDRMGRPAINTALIPPVPRSNTADFGDLRNLFNAGLPRNDVANFKTPMVSVLKKVYGNSDARANFLASALLPDMLMFDVTSTAGFGTFIGPGGGILGNGRRLSDDVIDTELNVLSNGAFTTDNVGDDNGLKVTDGSVDPVSGKTRAIAFPYIGAANTPGGDFDTK